MPPEIPVTPIPPVASKWQVRNLAQAGRVDLTGEQFRRLEEMARSRTLSARSVLPAKIVLHRASGTGVKVLDKVLPVLLAAYTS
jgi:hypothetical protein